MELSEVDAAQLGAFQWTDQRFATGAPETRDLTSAVYSVPAAGERACLRFAWMTDQSDLSPETDILLQLVADALDTRLRRGESGRISVTKGHLRSV